MEKINGVNSVMLSVITGNTPRQEVVITSCSVNVSTWSVQSERKDYNDWGIFCGLMKTECCSAQSKRFTNIDVRSIS